jgi:hypothetical protein
MQAAIEQDYDKLGRVQGYLQSTMEMNLVLYHLDNDMSVYVNMDAVYALHQDSKSHNRVIVYIGNTLAYVSSHKQQCMTKSLTEAELVGLTNYMSKVELMEGFVCFITNENPMCQQSTRTVQQLSAW